MNACIFERTKYPGRKFLFSYCRFWPIISIYLYHVDDKTYPNFKLYEQY